MSETLPPADPRDPAAAEYAAQLFARSNVVRVRPGEMVSVQPRRFERYGVAYAVNRLSKAEHEWLVEFQRAAAQKRREDREAARAERRSRP